MNRLFLLFTLWAGVMSPAFAQDLTITGPETLCAGASTTLTAANCPGAVKWSTNETTTSITVNPTETTTYYVMCTNGTSTTVASHSPVVVPNVQISSSSGNCLSGSATLTATGLPVGSTVRWKKDGTLIPNARSLTYEATQPGSYTVEPQAEAWTWQNPLPDGEDFNDIYFTDDNTGIAVGNYGKIVRTTDGGETWTVIPYNAKNNLTSVHFTSPLVGWICIDSGSELLKTVDGGLTWSSVALPSYYNGKTKLYFTDSNHGWLIANNSSVLKTSDGGVTWTAYATGVSFAYGLFFTDNLTGWIVGESGQVRKTTDGGVTWTSVTVDANSYNGYTDVFFANATTGWIIGYGALYKTTDRGSTWTNSASSFPSGTFFYSIYFTNADYGVVATSAGIWNTLNAGGVWEPTISPRAVPTSIFMRSNSKAWIAGRSGQILKGYQGASHYAWEVTRGYGIYDQSTFSGSNLDFISSQVGWAQAGGYGILKTITGGKSWTALPNTSEFSGFDFVDASTGYAMKRYPSRIYKTTNGGTSWNELHNFTNSLYTSLLQFVTSTVGWVASGSTVYRTIDGGSNWTAHAPGITDIQSMYFLTTTEGWVGGANGQVAKTTDGGTTWTSVGTSLPYSIRNVYFKNSMEGWASDINYSTKKTTDGGATWVDNIINGSSTRFGDVRFADENLGIALTRSYYSNGGSIAFKTLDGGATWQQIETPNRTSFSTIRFSDPTNAWITDGSGRIMHYSAPAGGCTSNALTLTASPAAPTITASNPANVVCVGTPVTLTASGCSGTLQWSTGATTATITATTATTTYTAFCTATGGCQSRSNYSLGLIPVPELSASSTNLCANENVELRLNAAGINTSYFAWKRDGALLTDAGGSSYVANQAGTYTLEDTVTLGTWVTYNPTPHNYTYRDVFFTDQQTGYAVGDNGVIYKTTNAGDLWLPLASGTTNPLYKVQFADANTGYVLPSYGGYLLKTTDAGASWSRSFHNYYNNFYGQFFTDTQTGWIAGSGGTILKTTNGGQNWTPQSSGTSQTLQDVFFLNATTGWAVGSGGTVLKTTDGGQNWVAQSSGTSQTLYTVKFQNASTGWAVGESGTLVKTTDGGNTWTYSRVLGYYNILYSLDFIDATKAFIVGNFLIIKTNDGGNNFQASNLGKYGELRKITFVNSTIGFAVGSGARIFKTTDAGATWNSYLDTYELEIDGSSFVDDQIGWAKATNSGILLKTTNGGASWQKINYQISGRSPLSSIYDLEFTSATVGWVSGSGGIFKTTDGGQTWVNQINQGNDLFFLDSQRGWAVGYSNGATNVLRTTDGGATWQSVPVGSNNVSKVYFVSSTVGWAYGYNGSLYKSTDGGATWNAQSSGTSQSIRTLYFSDVNTGWLGAYGGLLKTQDGGATWNAVSFPTYSSPPAIKINGGIGWIINYDGTFYTKNNGQTWTQINVGGVYQEIHTASFLPSGAIFAAGSGRQMKFLPKPAGCAPAAVAILPAPAAPTVTASSVSLCEGETVTLTGSGCSGTLSWTGGSTAAAITVTPYASTTYTAYCAGANGCRSTTHTGIGVLPQVRLDTASTAPCNRPVFTASNVWSGIPLRWTKDNVLLENQTSTTFRASQAGTYRAEPEVSGLWVSQSGTPTSGSLLDVVFPTNSIGFAVGTAGVILKTTDGGATWTTLPSGTTNDLRRIQMLSATVGWVVGANSTILKTTDGGATWVKQNVSGNYYMYDLSFVDANVGWATGNYVIFYTNNGGATWTAQNSGTYSNLFSIHALSPTTAWISGPGLVLKTTNAGSNWTAVNVGITGSFQDIFFSDATHGWIASTNSTVIRTEDGGASWQSSRTIDTFNEYLNQVQFVNNLTGFARGLNQSYTTSDGGITWSTLATTNTEQINRLFMKNSTEGVAVTDGGGESLPPMGLAPGKAIVPFQVNMLVIFILSMPVGALS